MLLDIARDELYIKNKVYETMNKQMEQAERHSGAMVESMNNVSSEITDDLAMLVNAISNTCPQQMIPQQLWGNTHITVIRAIKCQLFLHLDCHSTLPVISGLRTFIHT